MVSTNSSIATCRFHSRAQGGAKLDRRIVLGFGHQCDPLGTSVQPLDGELAVDRGHPVVTGLQGAFDHQHVARINPSAGRRIAAHVQIEGSRWMLDQPRLISPMPYMAGH